MTRMAEVTRSAVQWVDLASISEASDDAIIGIATSGVITTCNRAASLLYGYPVDELIGFPAQILVPPELQSQEAAVLRAVVNGEPTGSYRTRRLRRDSTVVTVWLSFTPILDMAGTAVGVATVAYESPHLNVPDGDSDVDNPETRFAAAIAATDRGRPIDRSRPGDAQDRRFQAQVDTEYENERLEVYRAQDRFEVVMGKERAEERIHVQDAQDRFQQRMSEERAEERVHVQEAQDRFQVRMGEERAAERVQVEKVQDRFRMVMDAGRAEARSDRENLQAQMHQSQRLEVLGQLAGGVAHDFNNLLGVILNYAAFVAEELAAPDGNLAAAGRDVAHIQRAAERAAGLTHQLLAFARREIIQPKVLDLNQVVTEVEQLLRRTIGEDIVLSTDLVEQVWPILADAGQIEQVLVNLAVNARDAMVGGGTLRIDTANIVVENAADSLLTSGRYVRLRVSDSGPGMPADVREHAFEPFFTTKPEGSGTGLGLSTVHGIVAQAGGTITIHSQPGAGSTFTMLIPVTDEAATPIEDPQPYERVACGETVLIVEDQEALREVTERIFIRAGYHVLSADNGAAAVTLAAEYEGEIQLLVTDVVMPTMLGKEAADKIREIRPDIQVLFMSGYAQPILATQGRLDRDVNLIEKPFSASAIIEKAGRILNSEFDGFRTVKPSETEQP